jgi:PAS domain S-box-containing protein
MGVNGKEGRNTDCLKNQQGILPDLTNNDMGSPKNEGILRQLFFNFNKPIGIYGPVDGANDFTVKYLNKAAEKFLKTSAKDVLGQRVSAVFPFMEQFNLIAVLQRVWKTGLPESIPENSYQYKGSVYWAEAYVFKITSGDIVIIVEDITDRKKFEADVVYHARLLDSIPDAVISLDRAMIIKSWSKGAETTYGWKQDEVLGKKYGDIIKTRFTTDKMLNKIVDQSVKQGIWKKEYEQKTKDGAEILVISFMIPIRDSSNNCTDVVIVNRDITDIRKMEKAFRESEERFHSFIELNPAYAWMKDRNGHYVYMNNTLIKRRHVKNKDWRGTTDYDFWPQDVADQFKINDDEIFKSGKAVELVEKIRDFKGRVGWILVFKFPFNDSSGAKYVGGMGIDITDSIQTEILLKESKEQYRRLYETMLDGFISMKPLPQGQIIAYNDALKKMLGYSEKELQSLTYSDIVPEKWRALDAKIVAEQVLTRGYSDLFETEYLKKDGSLLPISLRIHLMKNENGEPQEMWAIVRDITKRNREQLALQHTKDQLRKFSIYLQNSLEEEKKILAGEIHDELGQMLTALKIDLAWLSKKLPPELDSLKQKTKNMITMVDETDNVVKRISSNLRPPILDDLGLVEALKWLIAQFQERTGIKCHLMLSNKDSFDKKHTTHLFRIIQESLTNVARHSQATEVKIRFTKGHDKLKVTIRDNGKGIPKSQINGDRSYGLMGMQERAMRLGGTLEISKTDIRGTTLRLILPVQENS